MNSIEINRNSITCIGGILIVATITCVFFWIYSLTSSNQNKEIISGNNKPTSISETFTADPSASVNPAATNTLCPSWKNKRNDISGSRIDVWELLYENKPNNKISWNEFKDQVVICNPTLKKNGFVFIKGNTYILP